MKNTFFLRYYGVALLLVPLGCGGPPPPPPQDMGPPGPPEASPRPSRPPEVSYDTATDGRFAEFVAQTAGGMVKQVPVGIERKGVLRVEVADAVSPEDVLPLTQSLLAGARKDFPGKPFTLSAYAP